MTFRANRLPVGLAFAALLAIAALLVGSTTAADAGSSADAAAVNKKKKRQQANRCEPRTEMIIDDSGSNSSTDLALPGNPGGVPGGFRGEFGRQYINFPTNAGDTLGAVKFDSFATSMFPPLEINGSNGPTMNAAFDALSANGGTNYDAGFSLGNAEYPKANNRIFMSDGQASPPTQHLNPKIKTYVIGYGPDVQADPTGVALLTGIATQTGGNVYFAQNASGIGPIVAAIAAEQHCERIVSFADTFTAAGQEFTHQFRPKGKSSDVSITWPTLGAQIDGGTGADLFVKGAQVAKVKTTRKARGSTFTTFRIVSKTKKGKKPKPVTLRVRSVTIPVDTTATTQVVR
jgi:hypothetical protein